MNRTLSCVVEHDSASDSNFAPDLSERPIRYYLKRQLRPFVFGVIALFFTNFFDILTPLALKAGIDAVLAKDTSTLGWTILAYCGATAGCTLFRYLWRIYFFGYFQHTVAEDLRNRIFRKFTELGPSFYSKNPVGRLMSLLSNDVNTFRMAMGPGILVLLDGLFLAGMIVPIMAWLSWSWTWKTLILLPAVPFLTRKMETLIHERFRIQQDRLSDVSANAQEIVSGIRVIKGFAHEELSRDAFNRRSREYEAACNRMSKVDAAFQPVMEFGIATGSVVLLWFCTPEVVRGAISVGTFVAFHEYIKRMMWPMSAIGIGISMIEQGRASFDRIKELLTAPTDIPDLGREKLETIESIEFENLSFRYDGATRDALAHVSLKITSGETIGVVGPVGAGKTTLMQLLCRLYPVHQGRLLINGRPVEEYTQSSLRRAISFVPQDAFLFSDTIIENLAFGLVATPEQEEIESSARHVNIDSEIRELPLSYESELGERGVNLSGGQKQRLTIARALIRRSQVVILDDSLSAVDGATEKAIVTELKSARALNARQTVLIISHRLATLKHADRIVVLNAGAIEAIGSHHELLAKSATYRNLHELQSSPTGTEAL
jgi:ATP-binding cassette subfamily B protein